MLKIEQGSGRLLPVPRLRLRSQVLRSSHDLARVITASPQEFLAEIDERLFLIGAGVSLGPDGASQEGAASLVDLLALDLNGRAVAVIVESSGESSCFARALLCSELLAGWKPQDFLRRLSAEAVERLRAFLLSDVERVNRDQRLILVAERYTNEVLWSAYGLRKQYGVDISLLRAMLAIDSGGEDQYLSFRREFPAVRSQWAALLPRQTETGSELQVGPDSEPERAARTAAVDPPADLPDSSEPSDKGEALRTLAGGFAEYLSHSLAAVTGSADLALREAPRDSSVRQRLEEINRVTERIVKLTDQLRVYAGRGARNVEKLDAIRLIEHVTESSSCLLIPNVELRTDLTGEMPGVDGDAEQIEQVLANLLNNAVEALPEQGGTIAIRAGRMTAPRDYLLRCHAAEDLPEGDYLYIELSDSGYGMDEDLKARIFDPFFSTKAAGRGLGLSAVLGIVRNHRGALRVESEPGKGSTFRVLFPLPEARAAAAAGQPLLHDSAGLGSGRTVLVVDDLESLRTLAAQTLEGEGFRVLTAADGWEALDVFAARAGEIDVIVLDWMMPNLDAEEAFRAIRRIRGDTRVILCSGFPDEEASSRFAGKKLTAYLRRPFRPETLIERIRQLLDEQPAANEAKAL